MKARWPIAAILLLALCAPGRATAAGPVSLAVFDFELIDTSLQGAAQGPQPAEQQRLQFISDALRRQLADSGRFRIVDLAPAAARIEQAGYLRSCNGCAAAIAHSLGAALAVTGTVQKVSNLILNINLYFDEAATGERVRAMSVDIRGNTDESWLHGVSYLVRNRILKDPVLSSGG